jgi:exoribonuclease R
MLMKISIHSRDYTLYDVQDNDNSVDINPIDLKLFDGDIFTYSDNVLNVIDSPIRNAIYLTGVLKLDDGKTYGRTSNKKRLLYKCMPSDKKLPLFLVPYDVRPGFNKKQKNKLILFKFSEWSQYHPYGSIIESIGEADNIMSLYSYKLYSKYLNHNLRPFIQETNKITNNVPDISLKNEDFIFSIDPTHCGDFDDAFSVKQFENNKYCVSVYITEIVSCLDKNNLWDFFTERVSSIYLPQKRLCMIPKSFSESFLSLQEKKTRSVIRVDLFFNEDGTRDLSSNILSIDNITITDVYIDKNFVYEEESLLKNDSYKKLFNLSKLIETNIENSHDLVSFWMIKTNEYCAGIMKMNQKGIFRNVTHNDNLNFGLNSWSHLSSQYVLYQNSQDNPYAQVTSPIRRIVDLLNQIVLCNLIKRSVYSNRVEDFLKEWLSKIEEINIETKKVRKLQFECSLLNHLNSESKKQYKGVVVEKSVCVSGLKKYVIYVQELKLFTKISKCEKNVELKQVLTVKFFVFNRETDMSKKIRCVIQEN